MFFDSLKKELEIRNFSPKTIKAYLYYNTDLVRYCQKDPTTISEIDIKEYVRYLLSERKVSSSTARFALKPEDFDLENKVLWVRQGKGKKDRQTIISDKIISDLANLLGDAETGHY